MERIGKCYIKEKIGKEERACSEKNKGDATFGIFFWFREGGFKKEF